MRPRFDSCIRQPTPPRQRIAPALVTAAVITLIVVANVAEARDDAETERQFENAYCESFPSNC